VGTLRPDGLEVRTQPQLRPIPFADAEGGSVRLRVSRIAASVVGFDYGVAAMTNFDDGTRPYPPPTEDFAPTIALRGWRPRVRWQAPTPVGLSILLLFHVIFGAAGYFWERQQLHIARVATSSSAQVVAATVSGVTSNCTSGRHSSCTRSVYVTYVLNGAQQQNVQLRDAGVHFYGSAVMVRVDPAEPRFAIENGRFSKTDLLAPLIIVLLFSFMDIGILRAYLRSRRRRRDEFTGEMY